MKEVCSFYVLKTETLNSLKTSSQGQDSKMTQPCLLPAQCHDLRWVLSPALQKQRTIHPRHKTVELTMLMYVHVIISAFGRWKQRDDRSKVSLGYIVKLSQKI